MHPSQWGDIRHLTHELRRVGQLRTLDLLSFDVKYLDRAATWLDQFHQPGNMTLEPEHVRLKYR